MKDTHLGWVTSSAVALSVLSAAIWLTPSALAHDENIYFAVQTGAAFTSLNNIRDVGGSFEEGTTADSPSLENSLFYGAKLGIYSRSGMLGLEAEMFRSNPDPKNELQVFYEPTFGPFNQTRGGTQQVTTSAINLIVRVPMSDRFVAHVGAGPALIKSKLHFGGEQEQTTTRVGLNTQLGVSYFITKAIAVTAEWKFNQAELDYPTHGTTEGFKSDYRAHHVGVSLSYAFDWESPIKAPFSLRELLGLQPSTIGPAQ